MSKGFISLSLTNTSYSDCPSYVSPTEKIRSHYKAIPYWLPFYYLSGKMFQRLNQTETKIKQTPVKSNIAANVTKLQKLCEKWICCRWLHLHLILTEHDSLWLLMNRWCNCRVRQNYTGIKCWWSSLLDQTPQYPSEVETLMNFKDALLQGMNYCWYEMEQPNTIRNFLLCNYIKNFIWKY